MFKTELHPSPSAQGINFKDPILLIGSCFAEVIGKKLAENKFTALRNPFGVIFNPLSIFKLLSYSVEKKLPPENSYLQQGDIYFNYDFHSIFSALHPEDLRDRIKKAISKTNSFIQRFEWLILSLGTAFVYRRVDDGEIVANCHKVPAKRFNKELLTEDEIKESFYSIFAKLQEINPHLKIILTVSPVRHLRDTLELNSASKSTLRLFAHQISNSIKNVSYFPSFEILMDDLRDYRFYKADLIHPSSQAEDYIWSKFSNTYFDEETRIFLGKWEKIKAALQHRALHPSSQAHQQFLLKTLEELKIIAADADVKEEIRQIKQQLA